MKINWRKLNLYSWYMNLGNEFAKAWSDDIRAYYANQNRKRFNAAKNFEELDRSKIRGSVFLKQGRYIDLTHEEIQDLIKEGDEAEFEPGGRFYVEGM